MSTVAQYLANARAGVAVKVALIGDSVGQGYRALDGAEATYIPSDTDNPLLPSYANKHRALLKTLNASSQLYNKAYSGWRTTEHIADGTVAQVIALGCDVAYVALGINDSDPTVGITSSAFQSNLTTIVNGLLAGGVGVVLIRENAVTGALSTLAPTAHGYMWGTTYLPIVDAVATATGAETVDFWTPFDNAFTASGFVGSGLMYDALHPGPTGHDLMALVLEQYLLNISAQFASAASFSASGHKATVGISVTQNSYWRQYGDIITVRAPIGTRVSTTATITAGVSGSVFFDGAHTYRFDVSTDGGSTWSASATVSAGANNVLLGCTATLGDTNLAARIAVPT